MVENASIVTPNPKPVRPKSDEHKPTPLELTEDQRVPVSSPMQVKKKQAEMYAPQVKELVDFIIDRMVVHPTDEEVTFGCEVHVGEGIAVTHPEYDTRGEDNDTSELSETDQLSEQAMRFIMKNAGKQLQSAGWEVTVAEGWIDVQSKIIV